MKEPLTPVPADKVALLPRKDRRMIARLNGLSNITGTRKPIINQDKKQEHGNNGHTR